MTETKEELDHVDVIAQIEIGEHLCHDGFYIDALTFF